MSAPILASAWAAQQGFSRQYASRLIQEGVIPTCLDGRVIPEEATAALEAFMDPAAARRRKGMAQEVVAHVQPEGGESLGHLLLRARINSEIQRGELAKLSRRKKEGDLLERSKAEDAVARMIQTIRDHFLSQPERVASQVAALTDARQIRDLLKADMVQGLSHLSQKILDVGRERSAQSV